MTDEVLLEVYGVPAPQGSKTAFSRGGRAVVVEGGSKTGRAAVADWRRAVRDKATQWCEEHDGWVPLAGAVEVEATYHLPRPASVKPGKRWFPSVKPDLDKVTRATGDALTGLVYKDDALVCHFDVWKLYTDAAPRATIRVRSLRAPGGDE